ncbi:hypothetical protein [Deinococcus sp.]|uniref:hypothetical protein n=1 Tax=Deinococcus sp. TaxID=47478 RepID=UPI003B5B7CEE
MTKLQMSTQKQKFTLPLLLLGTSLILSACGGGGTVAPEPEVEQPIPDQPIAILGTLVPFTSGEANKIEQQLTGLTAPILSSGNFDLGLPVTGTMNSKYGTLLNEKDNTFGLCTEGFTITAPDGFKSIAFTTLNSLKGSTFVAENNSPLFGSDAASYKAWWFATVDGTVTVKANCIGFGDIDQSLEFKKGWNVMDIMVTGSSTTISRAEDQTPGRLTWKNIKSAQALSAQALNPYIFNPWAALRK